jgi:hypothetical protein
MNRDTEATAAFLDGLSRTLVEMGERKRERERDEALGTELAAMLSEGVTLAPRGTWVHELQPGQAGVVNVGFVSVPEDAIDFSQTPVDALPQVARMLLYDHKE